MRSIDDRELQSTKPSRPLFLTGFAASWLAGAGFLFSTPLLADIDRSFDWPGNPPQRNLVVQVVMGDRNTALGNTTLNQAVMDAVANLNMDSAMSMWTWTFNNNAANPDITVSIGDLGRSGGAVTRGFPNVNADGRLRAGLTMIFDDTPAEGFQWNTAGANRMDPICVAMHELLHTARMDHMGAAGNYFHPVAVGQRPNNRRLTAMDITALADGAAAGIARMRRERVAPNADTIVTPEASLGISENGIVGMGTLSFGHATDLTVPDATSVFVSGMPVDARVIWGGNMLLEGTLALGSGSLAFELHYPDRVLAEFSPVPGVAESTLFPVVFDPFQGRWLSGVFSSSSFDPASNTMSFGSSSSALQSYLSSDGRLLVGVAGAVPEPGSVVLIGMSTIGLMYSRRRRKR